MMSGGENLGHVGTPIDPRTIFSQKPGTIIWVYSNGCGWCKRAGPVLEAVQRRGIPIRNISGDNETALKMLDDQGVRIEAFPTIFIVNSRGNLLQYKDAVQEDVLVRLATREAGV